jgi:elongation factor G
MGELHLEIIVDRMKREFGVEANVGKPQVAYRETITQGGRPSSKATSSSRAARASTAVARSNLEPNPGKGFEFETRSAAARIPKEYIKPIHGGMQRRWSAACSPASRWST